MSTNNHNSFKKDVFLIVLGAVLAGIPTLTSTYFQTTSEMNKQLLDKKIITLKDFMICNNKISNTILPQIEILISQCESLQAKLKEFDCDRLSTEVSILKSGMDKYVKTCTEYTCELNQVYVSTNVLFGLNLDLKNEDTHDIKMDKNNTNDSKFDSGNISNNFAAILESLQYGKKTWKETYNINNHIIKKLSSQVKY